MTFDRAKGVSRIRVRRSLAGGAGLAATIALLLGCSGGASQEQGVVSALPSSERVSPLASTAAGEPERSEAEASAGSEPLAVPATPAAGIAPARLRVPAIDLDEPLIDLGLLPDGTMEVPSDWSEAGWFTGGGRPGGRGPTVIAGHVDSTTGPAVFFRLTELEIGDLVEVTDVEGTVLAYRVYRVEDLPKDDYPTHEVFGALNTDELRLITCTGEFDPALLRHAENRVVFAYRAEP